ncbi:hypothetical protein BDN70DRAFT_933947 [Pholiota conissans]|uniref:Uncharacterized protein n=1 Tax=Pholiota conissans TaxID=109636 RepID=A0A9P6CZK3_9AGAR|nr:hypothetical protein BDN70DRAFT_933947 [Pholiota conissans]
MDALLSMNEKLDVEEQYRQIDEALSKLQTSEKCIGWRTIDHLVSSKWIGLTQISRHLRNIAKNSPTLWVDPPIDNLCWMEEMLERSKDAGLLINADLASGGIYPGLVLAMEHSLHIKVLSLDGVVPKAWNQLIRYLPKHAPQLEELKIDCPAFIPGNRNRSRPFRISIPNDILCETRRLRRLDLSFCDFDWNSHSHLLRSLTHFHMCCPAQRFRPTAEQFTDALKEMPGLVSLHLDHALPMIQKGKRPSWGPERIHLALLQDMELVSSTSELEAFFSGITFPPAAKVSVYMSFVSDYNNSSDDFAADRSRISGVVAGIARSYSDPACEQIFKSVLLERDTSPPTVQIDLYPHAPTNGHLLPGQNYRLSLVFRGVWDSKAQWITAPARQAVSTVGMLPEVDFVIAAEEAGKLVLEVLKFPRMRFNTPTPHGLIGLTTAMLQSYLIYRDVDLFSRVVANIDWDGREREATADTEDSDFEYTPSEDGDEYESDEDNNGDTD